MWRDECLSRKENDDFFPMVVVGNKIDLREGIPQSERVDQAQISQWCRDQGYGHIETSAKEGSGVEAAMMAVVGLALEAQRNSIRPSTSVKDKIELKTMYEPKKNGACGNCSI
jgi:GTPase SAR1 family protein